MELTTDPKVAPRFRMQDAVPPLPYNVMACAETTLQLCQRIMVVENILTLWANERCLCFGKCCSMIPLDISTANYMKLFSVLFKGTVNCWDFILSLVMHEMWVWCICGTVLMGKPEVLGKTSFPATLLTQAPKRSVVGSNPGPHGEKPATDRQGCGTTCEALLKEVHEWVGVHTQCNYDFMASLNACNL